MTTDNKMLALTKLHAWRFKGKTFGIEVSCHRLGDEWTWCVYALIYDNHPLFSNVEAAVETLPWHGGCTYEERMSQEPARGIRYDWQRKGEWLKIGCDYAHIFDEYVRMCDPSDGIPGSIQRDVEELFAALEARQ